MIGEQALEISLLAEPKAVRLVRSIVEQFCCANALSGTLMDDIKVVVSEACTNVVRHAYEDDVGYMNVRIAILPDCVRMSVSDAGRGLGPVSSATFSRNGDLSPGGLGIFIIKQLVDNASYMTESKGTEVRLEKYLKGNRSAIGDRQSAC